MKRNAILTPLFSPDQVAAALAAAPLEPVADTDNPPTRPQDWEHAISSHSLRELREQLAARRGPDQRGPQPRSTKVAVTVRYSPEVVTYFKATGAGWQTRMDAVLRDYVARHQRENGL